MADSHQQIAGSAGSIIGAAKVASRCATVLEWIDKRRSNPHGLYEFVKIKATLVEYGDNAAAASAVEQAIEQYLSRDLRAILAGIEKDAQLGIEHALNVIDTQVKRSREAHRAAAPD